MLVCTELSKEAFLESFPDGLNHWLLKWDRSGSRWWCAVLMFQVEVIGGSEKYIATCRKCYYQVSTTQNQPASVSPLKIIQVRAWPRLLSSWCYCMILWLLRAGTKMRLGIWLICKCKFWCTKKKWVTLSFLSISFQWEWRWIWRNTCG